MNLSNDWTLIVAMAHGGVIGRDGDLPWRLSSDLRRFKELTMGHCLLMGRKTMESIGRPLPGRQTIVLSRSGFSEEGGVRVASDLEAVAGLVEPGRKVMVVGGAQIYQQALPMCNDLYITEVKAKIEGDTFFPGFNREHWRLQSSEHIPAGPRDDYETEFQHWIRITKS